MKISELKIDQKIIINSFKYQYKGINKIRKSGFGTVQKIVFKGVDIEDEKHFDLDLLSKDKLKEENGIIEFK